MKYLSVCSGIEAATQAWHPLGWSPVAFSEIEPFPCKVLAHNYPGVPNLGDMTKFKEWNIEQPDLLVGGTPCQSFSVAGLRKGLDDPRGNLMLTYLAIADKYKVKWIVFENVPGILSSNGGKDFAVFLDALEELGYIADVDIIDAQFCGLAQRRRRVFVCAQSRESLLSSKTIASGLTISQCLAEILLLCLIVLRNQSATELPDLAFDATKPQHSLSRRMKLFEMEKEGQAQILVENLDVLRQLLELEQNDLESQIGRSSLVQKNIKMDIEFLISMETQNELENIGLSLRQNLEEVLRIANECITSTPSNETIESKIFSCAKMALLISEPITQSLSSSPPFWSAVLSLSTMMKEFTNYARSSSSSIFTEPQWVCAWGNFIGQAEQTSESLGNLRATNYESEIFPIIESLRGNPPPSRSKGQEIAADVANCIRGSGVGTERIGDTRGQDSVVAVAMRNVSPTITQNYGKQVDSSDTALGPNVICMSHGPANAEITEGYAPTLNCNHEQPIVFDEAQITSRANMSRVEPGLPCGTINKDSRMTIALAGNTIGREPQNGGNGNSFDESGASYTLTKTDVHAVAYPINTQIATRHKAMGEGTGMGIGEDGAVAYTLQAAHCHAVAFGVGEKPDVGHCLRSGASKADKHESTTYIAQTMQVRRLTPTECARLQGFPDDYLPQVPGYSDSAAYKSLGNSMACNVMQVIGQRIQMVENLSKERIAA